MGKWVCPNPNKVISKLDFKSEVAGDQDTETCLDNLEDSDSGDEAIEEAFPRKRLLTAPTPTGKLDQQNLMAFDLTNEKLKPMNFPSREGIRLSMDHRSLRKAVYSHSPELGLSDLTNRIQCPVQSDPKKYQRMDCWAITDRNIREAVVKIFEFTTFENLRIITLETYPPGSSNQKATFFIDIVTGNLAYFRIGGKQDRKLWSLQNFERGQIVDMINDPNVKKIKDLSDYNF